MPAASDKTPIYRRDYTPPSYLIRRISLQFNIREEHTEVTARMEVACNTAAGSGAGDPPDDLTLQGRNQELISVAIDGQLLDSSDYTLTGKELVIASVPEEFELEVVTRCQPGNNTSLEGLYRSGSILCTQCEAHGFSRITYFPDRPDVLAKYTVTIEADRDRYPILLANGNLLESMALDNGRHRVVWEDPYPKPCYLFALVAGDLACVEDSYTTAAGRDVRIRFYVEAGDEIRCGQAIEALKSAMAWDERTYGLEYDLDLYMVVAVGSFNMGAMENKGLNVFNSRYVLASSETATDQDIENIQAVIGHEYFHNWTGNRVTCRDWFQLSLKEGLTVFREHQFMENTLASSVQRIDHVRLLRSQQFAEDASPMAHPVRPDSYIEVNNFYTLTVYEKGCEVIRMQHSLLGQETFREGLRLYLDRHDGTAATIDDFLAAMSDAGGRDLGGFQLWYSQAGTPELKVREHYDARSNAYRLTFSQHTPPTPGQATKQPVPIPVKMALMTPQGEKLPCGGQGRRENTLLVDRAEQHFDFEDITEKPIPVLLRGFSAPVKLDYLYSRAELQTIVLHDDDGFSRWDAMQRLYQDVINSYMGDQTFDVGEFAQICHGFLKLPQSDYALSAELLRLPSEMMLAEHYEPVPVDLLVAARDQCETGLAGQLADVLSGLYRDIDCAIPYRADGAEVGKRRLKNLCLYYLTLVNEQGRRLALEQYRQSDNMTDCLAALEALNHVDCEEREQAQGDFARRWRHDPLVMDKWYALQALSRLPDALHRVQSVRHSAEFDADNPNRIHALIGTFCMHNMRGFHRADGSAYQWLAEEILRLDRINPQVAARLCIPLCRWQRHEQERAEQMQSALRDIAGDKAISADVYEIVTKALCADA